MNHPKRLLATSRRRYDARLSLESHASSNGGWMSAFPKDSDDDDDGWRFDLRGRKGGKDESSRRSNLPTKSTVGGDQMMALRYSDSDDDDDGSVLGSPGKKSSSPRRKKKARGKPRWSDGCGSDDGSGDDGSSSEDSTICGTSSSSSEGSVEEIKKVARTKVASKKVASKKVLSQKPSESLKRPAPRPKPEGGKATTKAKKMSRASLDKVRAAGVRERTTPRNAPRSEAVRLGKSEANTAAIPDAIARVAHLQWHRLRLSEARERLRPCRVLRGEEAAEQRRRLTGTDRARGTTKVIQYLEFPNVDDGKVKIVEEGTLLPFGYTSRDGVSTTFNDDHFRQYVDQAARTTGAGELEAVKAYLKRVFDHARERQREAKEDGEDSGSEEEDGEEPRCPTSERKQVQFVALEKEGRDSDDEADHDDLDVPYTQAITFDPDDFDTGEERSNEPLRSGDVVEYYSPIYVAGDSRGLRQATVLSVKPDEEIALVLSNGEVVPNTTKVKRIKVKAGRDLLEHSGIFRPIDRFRLVGGGSATAADAVAMEAARFGKIMQKNVSKLKKKAEAEGFAPMDLLVNMKGVKTNSSSKSAVSKSKTPISMGSRRKERELLLSSSSDESSSEDDATEMKKSLAKPRNDNPNHNKENNGTAIGKGKKMPSFGSLSSASLGSSLASSDDDSSVDMTPLNLGKNHSKLTQYEKFTSSKRKKKGTSLKSSVNAFDLSLSSDDEESGSILSKTKKPKSSTQWKASSASEMLSPDKSVFSQSSLGTPCFPMKKVPYKKASSTSSTGDINKGGKDVARKAPLSPSSQSSEDSSLSSPLRPSLRKATGTAAGKLGAKKRSSPSIGLSSEDEAEDSIRLKPTKYGKPKARKQSDERLVTNGASAKVSMGWTQENGQSTGFGGLKLHRVKTSKKKKSSKT